MELIDRDALMNFITEQTENPTDEIIAAVCRGAALSMTTIEAVPVRHGKWIMTICTSTSKRNRVISFGKYNCSICGYGNGRKKSNYCPRCGADMREMVGGSDRADKRRKEKQLEDG